LDNELLTALRYKSEGTDIDFKAEAYRLAGASEHERSEMLKDMLAMANAWRDGTGYILLGLKDQRPLPAEVLGIFGHLDDADLQQFVHAKVKPKLTFHYEEHVYEGKTIGVITIPKQKRAFYLANAYGKLKSNVVYVRRGSSTAEAEPPEINDMVQADEGRGNMRVELAVLTPENTGLPDSFAQRYLKVLQPLPDYSRARSYSNGLMEVSLHHDNSDYWRELSEYIRVNSALVEMRFVLFNRSERQLSNAKLEVTIEALDGQDIEILPGGRLPKSPRSQWSVDSLIRSSSTMAVAIESKFVVEDDGPTPVCHVRFGTLLPGEEGRSVDTLAVTPLGPGKLRLNCRILASELAAPIESDRVIVATGELEELDFEGLKLLMRKGST
jgi:hypothetical protein